MTNEVQPPAPNNGERPDMILGVIYEEYKPETYAGIVIEPLAAHEGQTVITGRTFFGGNGFEADLTDATSWLKENHLVAVCRSSFDHYQTDRKQAPRATPEV